MAFHDVRFPDAISYGSKGGPGFSTSVLQLASGFEKRNINWSQLRAKYDVMHGVKTQEQMEELLNFFIVRNGKAHSFRFKDFLDFTIIDQTLTSTVATRDFQLIKTYSSGSHGYDRLITKPVSGTISGVKINGFGITLDDGYSLDLATGNIHILGGATPAPGTEVTIEYVEFDVHARFDTDEMDAAHDAWREMTWSSIPIVEIKERFPS
jgi:uncharacterized protein (TIGR02217 family)